jgi:hypothetical protein
MGRGVQRAGGHLHPVDRIHCCALNPRQSGLTLVETASNRFKLPSESMEVVGQSRLIRGNTFTAAKNKPPKPPIPAPSFGP